MKFQALFSLKNKNKIKMASAAVVIRTLMLSTLAIFCFSRRLLKSFLLGFFHDTGLDISCKFSPMEISYEKCQILFSGEYKKKM